MDRVWWTSSTTDRYEFLVQAKTSVPIPEILDWSDDASNATGSEYIIMEHALGSPLHQKWPTMDVSDQIRCIEAVYKNLKEVADLKFPGYGSLYFADTPYVTTSKLSLDQEFCIGPHCGSIHWNCNVGQPRCYHNVNPNQGPCKLYYVPSDMSDTKQILQGLNLPHTVTVS